MDYKVKRSITIKPRALMVIAMGGLTEADWLANKNADAIDEGLARYMDKHKLVIEVNRSASGLSLVFAQQPHGEGLDKADDTGNA